MTMLGWRRSNQPLDNALRGSDAKTLDVSTSSSVSTSGELPFEWERESDNDNHDFSEGDGDGNVDDEGRRDELLVANVSELLARMLDSHQDDNNAAESERHDCSSADNAGGDSDDDPSPRECFLRATLAQTLVELSAKQTDLQLAASAGKELLEQLGEAKDEASELLDHLHTCQQRLESVETENTMLAERLGLTEPERRVSADLRDERVSTPAVHDDSRQCPQHSRDEMAVALHENNELKRRCLELERQQGTQRLEVEELQHQREALRAAFDQLRLRHDVALQDLEDLRSEHAQLRGDHHDVLAARDNLRLVTRRLQSEKDALAQKLDARETLVASLEDGRRTAGTHAQVLENRAARLRTDNEELLQALAKAREQQQAERSVYYDDEQHSDGGSVSLQQHARDLENLLDEAQRSLAALKLENRALRRQQMQQVRQLASGSTAAEVPLRRTKSMTVTCADILAADEARRAEQEDCGRQPRTDEPPTGLSAVLHPEPESRANTPSELHDAPQPLQPPNSPLLRLFAPARRRRTVAANTCTDELSLRDQQRPRRTTVVGGSEIEDDGDAHMDKAPLYLGLSVIACATAAAGLLSRR